MSRGGFWRCRSSWRGSCSVVRKSFVSLKRRGSLLLKKLRGRMVIRI